MTVQGHDSFGFSDPDYQNPRDFAAMGESEGYHDYDPSCACFECMKQQKAEKKENDNA